MALTDNANSALAILIDADNANPAIVQYSKLSDLLKAIELLEIDRREQTVWVREKPRQ